MAKTIKINKGLDIRLKGKAQETVREIPVQGIYSVVPDDFYGFKPKPVVKEGELVKAGDPLFVNKEVMALKVVSPVSGKVVGVVRGERRKLLSIQVEADGQQQYKDFGSKDAAKMSAEEVKALLLEGGMFAFMRQRPFDVVPNPEDTPKGIFISAFSKMPLAQDFSFALKGGEEYFKAGVEALSKIAPVSLCISPEQQDTALASMPNAEVYVVKGPNPAGNVGVQINHISPINKGEVAWTIGPEEVVWIGRLVNEGKVDMTRMVAVAGSEIKEPGYCKTLVGTPLKAMLEGQVGEGAQIINGNPLVGAKATMDSALAARATEVTAIPDGSVKDEAFGWIMPRFNDFSTSRSYFSWLQPKKEYNLDTRIKGGERHIIMSGEYDKVLPMDIYAGYLIKAILTGDIDRMEALGIYEVAPEDFAVAEFVDSSKLELQRIVREGLDMLRKEVE